MGEGTYYLASVTTPHPGLLPVMGEGTVFSPHRGIGFIARFLAPNRGRGLR